MSTLERKSAKLFYYMKVNNKILSNSIEKF